MDTDGTSAPGRVVAFSPEPSFAAPAGGPSDGPHVACVGTATAYEAAAEVLAGGVLALVIDLRVMTPGQMPLLRIARDRQVEILAVGSLPFGVGADDLSGVRLTSRADLPGVVAHIAGGPAARRSGALRPERPAAPAQSLLSPEELAALLEEQI